MSATADESLDMVRSLIEAIPTDGTPFYTDADTVEATLAYLETVSARMRELEADAEVGQLLREVRERWGDNLMAVTLYYPPRPEGYVATATVGNEAWETKSGSGPTLAEALRALLGEG